MARLLLQAVMRLATPACCTGLVLELPHPPLCLPLPLRRKLTRPCSNPTKGIVCPVPSASVNVQLEVEVDRSQQVVSVYRRERRAGQNCGFASAGMYGSSWTVGARGRMCCCLAVLKNSTPLPLQGPPSSKAALQLRLGVLYAGLHF